MIYLDPKDIFYRSFVFTEKNQPEWEQEIPHWHSYIQHFFHSNGLQLTAEQERVNEWINSPERAAFSDMILALLPEVQAVISPDRIRTLLMAHWTPDLHMGTSVVNATIHALGLADCLALAISDRGPDAAIFALDGLNDCLAGKDEDGLLLIAEQKNLMYHSPLLDQLKPENNACVCLVNTLRRGLQYRGYVRHLQDKLSGSLVREVIRKAELDGTNTVVIGPSSALEAINGEFQTHPTEASLLSAAPFVALSKHCQPEKNYLLVSAFQGEFSFSAFAGEQAR
ncbi:hypothetical protein Dpoa2040_000938 [Dickeya sp. CFBP 2040]|uniref:hypothetical protein n=1 Tax=Dickeya sp. CFBP 2040 TaxID=2718531 RepID=UPI001444B1C0|nr:hypothetical protein [Dickeya sp. CFBP 2040]NKI73719.1 hypothetical protein [Dickeya sp. CFBP 2040]